MKAEIRIPILMLRTEKGSIDSYWPLTFEASKVYMTSMTMAKHFIDTGAAAVSVIPPHGCWHCRIASDGQSADWQLVCPKA